LTKETLLLRQVHPSWVKCGQLTSQAFNPTSKDQNLLSVYDGDLITAQDAWEHFCHVLKLQSLGVVAVTVRECQTEQLEVRSDPATFPEHAIIDFSTLSRKDVRIKAENLRDAAEARGWLYKSERLSLGE
jgi:hypothetical protein